jgi:NodT family efflux transporter outer membrane factor (OMF) lipoprotein
MVAGRYLLTSISRLFHLCAALLLCACVGYSDKPVSTILVPEAWSKNSAPAGTIDTKSLTAWWERFQDPVLNELITGALRTSPTVHLALSKIAEYRARRGVSQAALYPSLNANASGGATHAWDLKSNHSNTAQSYRASMDASWQVDLFGVQKETVNAAGADLGQTQEIFYGVQVTLAADVATAYVTLRSAEAQLGVVQNSLETRQETVQLTRWREQAGTGTALDTQQSITTLEQARVLIPSLQLIIAQTRNQLALLSGQTPGAMDALLLPAHRVPAVTADLSIGIPAETLRQRPDVRAAERVIEAAFARTKVAERQRLPSLTLTSSLLVEALKAGHIFSPESAAATLFGYLSAPLFDAGRITQNILIQTEIQKQSVAAYETTVLTALAEVENALVAVQRDGERFDILVRAIAAAQEASTLSGLQYQAGQVDLFISLEAQRTLLSLQEQQVATTADRATASIQLYKALGGGWSAL